MAAIFASDIEAQELNKPDRSNQPAFASQEPAEQNTGTEGAPEGKPDESAPATDAEIQSGASKTGTESDTVDGESEVKAKADGGWQRRIDKLTKERAEALRRTEELERRLAEVTAEPKQTTAAAETEAEPDPEQFESIAEFTKAHSKWAARQATQEALQVERFKTATAIASEVAVKREQEWLAKLSAAKAELPDLAEVIESLDSVDVVFPNETLNAITRSDSGPKLFHYLAKNPAEQARIAALPVTMQLMAIGRLDAKLSNGQSAGTTPSPKTKATPPEPIKPVPASGEAATTPNPYTDAGRMTAAQWAKWRDGRNAEEAKKLGLPAR